MSERATVKYKGIRLYRDFTHVGVKYTQWQPMYLAAINEKYKFSSVKWLLLLDIMMNYECEKQKPCGYSYDELADKYRYHKRAIRDAIETLIKESLIICLNMETRKGKAKFQYVPNVEKLHKLFDEYRKKIHFEKSKKKTVVCINNAHKRP